MCRCHFVIGQQPVYGLSLFLAVFRGPAVLSPARMDSSSMATTASPVTVSVLPVPVPPPTSPLFSSLCLWFYVALAICHVTLDMFQVNVEDHMSPDNCAPALTKSQSAAPCPHGETYISQLHLLGRTGVLGKQTQLKTQECLQAPLKESETEGYNVVNGCGFHRLLWNSVLQPFLRLFFSFLFLACVLH